MTPRSKALRVSLAVTACALLGMTAAVIGQNAPPATATPAVSEKQVIVTLKYDPKNPSVPIGIETPNPDPVQLGKRNKAHWYLSPKEIGSLKIEMKTSDPLPFRGNPKNNGKDSVSETPDRGTKGKSYEYKVTVHVDSLNKDLVLDPIIIITE